MEMFEIEYFLAVAETENIQKASEALHVSPSSLSKAIARLSEELKVDLIQKDGRGIKLTEAGRVFFEQSQKFAALKKETYLKMAREEARLSIRIGGPEIFLSHFGVNLCKKIKLKHPHITFEFISMKEEEVEAALLGSSIDLAISSDFQNRNPQLNQTLLAETQFHTYLGRSHPLFKKSKIGINEVLGYEFLQPEAAALGPIKGSEQPDGWREDQFPRKMAFKNVGIKAIESLVTEGLALAYLPSYYADQLPFKKIEITDCPFKCGQKILLKTHKSSIWLKEILL